MAKYKVTVDIKAKGSESKMTFESTRQLFGWLVRNPKAKVGADKSGNWFITVKMVFLFIASVCVQAEPLLQQHQKKAGLSLMA